jgi:hypothetical protein
MVRSARNNEKQINSVSLNNPRPAFTHPLLQNVPLRLGIVKHLVLQSHHHLAQKIVATEHVAVPHRQPEGARLQTVQCHVEAQRFVEHGIERVLPDTSFPLARLGLVGQ